MLTEAGERLLSHARTVARSLERATSAMNERVGPTCVTVEVYEAAVPFVVPHLAQLAEQMPDCDAHIELVTPPVATLSRPQRAIVEALYPHSGREWVSA